MPRENSFDRNPRQRSKSRSRSRGDRYDRDDNRRRSDYRDRSRDRRQSRDRSRNRERDHSEEKFRIHVADLSESVTQYDIEKTFMKFGEIVEVWMAKSPPCFAFVVFKNKADATEAVKEMDNKTIGYNRCRVTFAKPRTRGMRQRRWDPDMRCFQCGERGHFSRDCNGSSSSSRRRYERSRSRGRYSRRSYSRGRSRSR